MILLKTQQVDQFGWIFSLMNFFGLAFLAARSIAIAEWAFVAINLLTTTFWGMVVVLKVLTRARTRRSARPIATDPPAAA